MGTSLPSEVPVDGLIALLSACAPKASAHVILTPEAYTDGRPDVSLEVPAHETPDLSDAPATSSSVTSPFPQTAGYPLISYCTRPLVSRGTAIGLQACDSQHRYFPTLSPEVLPVTRAI